jgi:hypothetical protein
VQAPSLDLFNGCDSFVWLLGGTPAWAFERRTSLAPLTAFGEPDFMIQRAKPPMLVQRGAVERSRTAMRHGGG